MTIFERLKLAIHLSALEKTTKSDQPVISWTNAWLTGQDRSESGASGVSSRRRTPGTLSARAASFWARSLTETEHPDAFEKAVDRLLEEVFDLLGYTDEGILLAAKEIEARYPEHKNLEEPDGYRSYVDKGKEFLPRERWEKMLDEQEHKCLICKKHKSLCIKYFPKLKMKGFGLLVDHDHATGKIRGLLCTSCNLGLGHFKESLFVLRNAIEYLQKHSLTTTSQFENISA